MIENLTPRVSICCLVHNHEPYLRECFEGFVMQKTNFSFEVLVHDDASTDNTANIIREYESKYPEIIKPIYQKENQYSKGIPISVTYQFPRAKGKYIAMCEGDDYWTDPYKLQKQVDFLEANEDYVLCFHNVNVLNKSDIAVSTELYSQLETREFSAYQIYDKWTIPTCSVVFRNFINKIKWNKNIVFGDIYLFLSLMEYGKAYCLDFIGATYRRHATGISVNINVDSVCKLFNQYRFMEKRFPALKEISVKKKNDYLEQLIYAPFFKGIWKYRFYKMRQEPKLIFSTFFTTTLTSYIIQRKKR